MGRRSGEGARIHHSHFEQPPETTPDPARPTSAPLPSLPSIGFTSALIVDHARHLDADAGSSCVVGSALRHEERLRERFMIC